MCFLVQTLPIKSGKLMNFSKSNATLKLDCHTTQYTYNTGLGQLVLPHIPRSRSGRSPVSTTTTDGPEGGPGGGLIHGTHSLRRQ